MVQVVEPVETTSITMHKTPVVELVETTFEEQIKQLLLSLKPRKARFAGLSGHRSVPVAEPVEATD